ncbi:MAG: helix-turn-helix transcriptional regulator [Myxococcales bacterium]|nr:helix-turn-helix transcriptional regulator [Myxococcales bacterium]
MARPDHPLHEVLDQHARLLLERLPAADGLIADVRRAITGELRGGDPSLRRIAKMLVTSPRTLQRRLHELGAVYGDLVDDLRRAAALSYLADRELALGEIAYLLGFGEQSSFTRAFKRWTGRTPVEHRRGR